MCKDLGERHFLWMDDAFGRPWGIHVKVLVFSPFQPQKKDDPQQRKSPSRSSEPVMDLLGLGKSLAWGWGVPHCFAGPCSLLKTSLGCLL